MRRRADRAQIVGGGGGRRGRACVFGLGCGCGLTVRFRLTFGIGLTVISQQVSEIDHGVLTQLNTELTMSLGNEGERKEAIRNASSDLFGFERELQVMSRGQVIASASYRDIPLPVQAPDFDVMEDT